MRVLQALGALVVAATLTTGIARADLWLNIKAPLRVGDTGTLPAQGCELMSRNTQMESVRCYVKPIHTGKYQHVDTIGSKGARCRVLMQSGAIMWGVETNGACSASKQNSNTYQITQK